MYIQGQMDIEGSTEKFLLHSEIIAEIKAIPQVIIKHEEEVQANAITRAQRLQKDREEAEAIDDAEEREDEGKSEHENESDETSDEESSITSDRIRPRECCM